MSIVGHVEADKQSYKLGQPIPVTLSIKNEGKATAYLFVPTGRSGGIHIEVKQGEKVEVKDLLNEPEPGLQPEIRIAPGETLTRELFITEYLSFGEPGSYIVECAIPIEVSDQSLRLADEKRVSNETIVRSSVRFTIVP